MGRLLAIGPDVGLVAALTPALREHDLVICAGSVEALQRVRDLAVDVVITDPNTSVSEDLALAAELRSIRPGVRLIVMAPATTHDDVVAALRA